MSKKVSGWPLIAPTEVDTSITGDQVMEALAADVEASDNDKVLTAVYGGLEGEETGSVMWASPLPIIGEGDAGKVLTVNAGETRAEWAEPSGGGGLIVDLTIDMETGVATANASYNDVVGAIINGASPIFRMPASNNRYYTGWVTGYGAVGNLYGVYVAFMIESATNNVPFTADTASDPLMGDMEG